MRVLTGGGRAEINFSNFFASPSFPSTASMTQPRWNVGSHGNPLWVLCSDGCRGCYRWSGCGGASAGNALKMVCISAVHLAEGFFFFALRFVEPCLGGRSAFALPREPEGPACSWHTSILAPFGTAPWPEGTKAAAQAGQQNALSSPLLAAFFRVSPCLQPPLIHALLALIELLPVLGAVCSLGKLGEL